MLKQLNGYSVIFGFVTENRHCSVSHLGLLFSMSLFSSDRCSITYPWLVLVVVLVVLLFFLCRFNFSQERLGIIHCNFADMFSMLLLNYSQSLNTFEILVWDIFAFFASEFVDFAAKQAFIGELSNENQIT